jgi:hypothetical protein
MPRRSLIRNVDFPTSSGWQASKVSTVAAKKRGNYKNDRVKVLTDAIVRSQVADLLEQLTLGIKAQTSVAALFDLLVGQYDFDPQQVGEIFEATLTDFDLAEVKKLLRSDKRDLSKLLQNAYDFHHSFLKKTGPISTKSTSPKKSGGVQIVVRNSSTTRRNGVAKSGSIWVYPLLATQRPEKVKKFSLSDCQKIWLMILKVWRSILYPSKNDVHGTDKNFHHKQSFYVSLDCEWKMTDYASGKHERALDDVLSMQLAGTDKERASGIRKAVIHNETHQHFQFSELLAAIYELVKPLLVTNPDGSKPDKLSVTLLTYFGGVDLSCFAGWDLKLHDFIVLNKNYAFTRQPLIFTFNDVTLSILFRDVGLIAPSGGLQALGNAIGKPKIDTEAWDKADGLAIGYYKSHMDVLRTRHRDWYNQYALLDAEITLEYALQTFKVYPDWAKKLPATLGSYAASQVAELMIHGNPEQSIFDRERFTSSDIANSQGVQCVRFGQADLFKLAVESYFGGYNVAFMSGRSYGRVVDTDLVSAYNAGGHLLSCLDYTDSHYLQVPDADLTAHWCLHPLHLTAKNDFKAVAALLERQPFVQGVGEFDIQLPANAPLAITPSLSKVNSYGPCYPRAVHGKMTLIDAYNAYAMGATVMIVDALIPKQSFDDLNVFALIQDRELVSRQAAKRRLANAKLHGDKLAMQRYDFNQSLHKLVGNTIYGKTGQGTSLSKRARNFDTNEMQSIPYSAITDPLIASSYTAFTRYLVTKLYISVQEAYKHSVGLNITTDGYTFLLPAAETFDEQRVRKLFLAKMCPFYMDRMKDAFGVVNGFELKGNVIDHVFNLRTRVNGTLKHDEAHGGITALASMHGLAPADVYHELTSDHFWLTNPTIRMSNLTEMKHHAKNKWGHQEVWEQPKRVGLQYDFARKPDKLIIDKDKCYVTTVPFASVDEHDQYKKRASMMTRMMPIAQTSAMFDAFIKTMNQQNLTLRKPDFDPDKPEVFTVYCFKNWASVMIDTNQLSSLASLYSIADDFKINRNTLRHYVQGHKRQFQNINYLAAYWYATHLQSSLASD